MGVAIEQVKNVHIWGNHSATQFPSVYHGTVADYPAAGFDQPIDTAVADDEWLKGKFITDVQKRGAAIIKARKKSSAASAAAAVCDHMHDWVWGSPEGEAVSMGVISDGNSYGIASDIVFSFPVTCKGGEWKIVDGYTHNSFAQDKLKKTEKELLEERKMALGI